MQTQDKHQSCQCPSSLCLNSQLSNLQVPTVDIKRGTERHIQWDKKRKECIESLFPPSSPLSLPFSLDYMDMLGRDREQAEKEQWRESQWMRGGLGKRQSMNPFHPRCICAAPLTIIEVWDPYCFDGWLGLYWLTLEPAQGTRGQETERKEWSVHVCTFTVHCSLNHCRRGTAALGLRLCAHMHMWIRKRLKKPEKKASLSLVHWGIKSISWISQTH